MDLMGTARWGQAKRGQRFDPLGAFSPCSSASRASRLTFAFVSCLLLLRPVSSDLFQLPSSQLSFNSGRGSFSQVPGKRSHNAPILPSHINKIFGPLEAIYRLHTGFLADLQAILEKWEGVDEATEKVVELFFDLVPHMSVYGDYISNHVHAMTELEQLCSGSAQLNEFLRCQVNAAYWEAYSAEARTNNVEPIAPHARAKEVIMQLRKNPDMFKDRWKQVRKVRKCFVGAEFVAWALAVELAATRESATALGQLLVDYKMVLRVAGRNNVFKDKKDAWYRCKEDDSAEAEEKKGDGDDDIMSSQHDDLVVLKGLRDSAIFRMVPRDAINRLAANCQLLNLVRGDNVIVAGSKEDEIMYIIASGTVGVYVDGVDTAVTYMSSGRFFGEMSLLTGMPRTATIRAEEACKLIQVTLLALAPLVQAMPQLIDQIAETITMRRCRPSACALPARRRVAVRARRSDLLRRFAMLTVSASR